LPDATGFLTRLQTEAPHARMLMTAREPPAEPGWSVLALGGLPAPVEDDEPPLAGATAAEQLFLDAARRNSPRLDTTTADWPAVQRLCRLVDGLPLAIELLAAWIPLAPPAELAAQLNRYLSKPAPGSAPPVHERILSAVFECLWGFLAEEEARCLSRLSVFRGEFDSAAAQNIAGASPFFLSALVDRAFVIKLPGERYALQGLLREHARGKLAADALAQTKVLQGHAAYFLEWAECADSEFQPAEPAAWLERFDAEYDSVRSALDWAISTRQTDTAVRLTAATRRYWAMRGYLQEGRFYLDAVQMLAQKTGGAFALASVPDDGSTLRLITHTEN
jgi:predicted ATPase